MRSPLKNKKSKEEALESLKDISDELGKMKLESSEKDSLHTQREIIPPEKKSSCKFGKGL